MPVLQADGGVPGNPAHFDPSRGLGSHTADSDPCRPLIPRPVVHLDGPSFWRARDVGTAASSGQGLADHQICGGYCRWNRAGRRAHLGARPADGAVIIVPIKNDLVMLEANVYYEQTFSGSIILLAVVVSRVRDLYGGRSGG